MGYSWQIKPDDSMSLPFLTYSPANVIYRTISQIKGYLTAKGYNAALLTWNSRGGYNGYMIVTHFGNINSDLHLATDVYFSKSNYTIGYPKPASSSIEQTWMFYVYNDGSGIVNQTGSTWNRFAETKTVDGITYWTPKNPSSEHPPIYVTTYDGNIYYHGDVPSSWRNITLNLNWGSAFQCEITDFNLLNLTSWPDDISSYVQAPTGKNADFSGGTMFGSSPNYVSGRRDGTSITVYMDVYMQGYSHFVYGNENLANSQRWGFVAAVDDVSQKGFFAMLIKDSGFSRVSFWAGTSPPSLNHTWRNGMYTLLIGSEHIYNWQSVTYIGNYLLSNILNINNGEPVNNVSVQGNLSLASQTAVDSLISEVVLDMSKIKVTYSIPSDTYSYIKLVYKRGSAPTSVSDGTAITITQVSTEQIIDGIADGGTYWFVIFTDISRSNAMSIETEAVPMILWDKDLGVKHPMCSDYVSVKQNYDAYLWEFIDTYRLVGSGSNTPPGAGNTSITFQKGIKRKYATKMYIEIQCSRSYTLQWANSAMRLADTKTATGALPSGYLRVNFVSGNSGGVTDNYTHTTPYYTLPKMLIEIDISSVGADTMWYLAFWKCNEYTEITKCYFNAPVEIES